jgi:acyl-coenzyme A synthetase/AMP-(fatty) acid ligase
MLYVNKKLSILYPKFQEVSYAFVVPRPGVSISEEGLKKFLAPRITDFKTPKEFDVRAALPYLPNSKIDKQALRAELNAKFG